MQESFQVDVVARLKKDKSANVDIRDIIVKYIPLGTPKDRALQNLADLGFAVYEVKPEHFNRQLYDGAVVGVIEQGASGLNSEIRVGLDFKDSVVKQVGGRLIHRAP